MKKILFKKFLFCHKISEFRLELALHICSIKRLFSVFPKISRKMSNALGRAHFYKKWTLKGAMPRWWYFIGCSFCMWKLMLPCLKLIARTLDNFIIHYYQTTDFINKLITSLQFSKQAPIDFYRLKVVYKHSDNFN